MQVKRDSVVLQKQQGNQDQKPVSFASRFLSEFESKCSINKLGMLVVVWALEHFKDYV